ncbi:MAG: oxygenase MpaB family protein [Dietzia sp.]
MTTSASESEPMKEPGSIQEDLGYFGPGSMSWRVFLHPATQVMIAQITNLLESPHIVFQHVLINHDPVFGAESRTAHHGDGPRVTFYDRVVRTVSVPAPLLFGSTAEADKAARQLFNYHRPMRGTLSDTREPYAATDASSMLFAAVTIVHAALLAYENLAYDDGRKVAPLTEDEVTQYLTESSRFGALMGAPTEQFPTSREELARYYESVSEEFRTTTGWTRERVRAAGRLVRPGDGRRPRHVATDVMLLLSQLMSVAVLPAEFRRLNGVPAALDPILRVMFVCATPAFWALGTSRRLTEKVHQIYRRGDPQTTRLLDNALELERRRASAE